MSGNRLSSLAGNWFVVISCALFWILSFAAVVFYRFQVKPTINHMKSQQEVPGKALADLALPFISDHVVQRYPEIDSMFRATRDSLESYSQSGFVTDFAQGSIEIICENNSEAVVLKYYLDCGCPLEDDRLDMLCFPVDISGVPRKLDHVIYEGVVRSVSRATPPLRSFKSVANTVD